MGIFRKRVISPSIAEQDVIIEYLRSATEAELVARFNGDKEFRHTADAVFGCCLGRGHKEECEFSSECGGSRFQVKSNVTD